MAFEELQGILNVNTLLCNLIPKSDKINYILTETAQSRRKVIKILYSRDEY